MSVPPVAAGGTRSNAGDTTVNGFDKTLDWVDRIGVAAMFATVGVILLFVARVLH